MRNLRRIPSFWVAPERYDLDALAYLREGVEFPLVDLRTLPDLDWILQDETTAVRKGINKICRKLNYQIRPKLEVTSSTIALQAAESQMGCCVVALGHLAYLNHREHLRFYQISAEGLFLGGRRIPSGENFSRRRSGTASPA